MGYVYDETHMDSFVQTQLQIEKHIEAALVEDGYARKSVFQKIDQIRGFLFYPEGKALSFKADSNHLTHSNWNCRYPKQYSISTGQKSPSLLSSLFRKKIIVE